MVDHVGIPSVNIWEDVCCATGIFLMQATSPFRKGQS